MLLSLFFILSINCALCSSVNSLFEFSLTFSGLSFSGSCCAGISSSIKPELKILSNLVYIFSMLLIFKYELISNFFSLNANIYLIVL